MTPTPPTDPAASDPARSDPAGSDPAGSDPARSDPAQPVPSADPRLSLGPSLSHDPSPSPGPVPPHDPVPESSAEVEVVRLGSPAELIAAVPYLLGFTPNASLVVLALRRTRLGVVQRLDLPDVDALPLGDVPTVSAFRQEFARLADAMADVIRRDGAEVVVLIGYEDDPGQSLPLRESVAERFTQLGLTVLDELVVIGDRWWSARCADVSCCPPQGNEMLRSPALAAPWVLRGLSPLASRAALEERIGRPRPELEPLATAVADQLRILRRESTAVTQSLAEGVRADPARRPPAGAGVDPRQVLRAWRRLLTAGLGHGDDPAADIALAAYGLWSSDVRDGLICWLAPGVVPENELTGAASRLVRSVLGARPWSTPASTTSRREERLPLSPRLTPEAVVDRLIDMAGLLPERDCPPLLAVLASLAWWRGDGALARVAIERAREAHPVYPLAVLLAQLLDHGIRPADLVARRAADSADAGPTDGSLGQTAAAGSEGGPRRSEGGVGKKLAG